MCLCFGICSARSRVRGTLEIYHAFIRDLDASDTSSSTNNEPDWELVNEGETEPDAESVAHTQVSLTFFVERPKMIHRFPELIRWFFFFQCKVN